MDSLTRIGEQGGKRRERERLGWIPHGRSCIVEASLSVSPSVGVVSLMIVVARSRLDPAPRAAAPRSLISDVSWFMSPSPLLLLPLLQSSSKICGSNMPSARDFSEGLHLLSATLQGKPIYSHVLTWAVICRWTSLCRLFSLLHLTVAVFWDVIFVHIQSFLNNWWRLQGFLSGLALEAMLCCE